AHRLLMANGAAQTRDLDIGNDRAVFEIEPAVVLPDAFLQRRLAAERATPFRRHRPSAKMRMVGLAIRSLDVLPMSCPLQDRFRMILRGDKMGVGMHLIGTVDIA